MSGRATITTPAVQHRALIACGRRPAAVAAAVRHPMISALVTESEGNISADSPRYAPTVATATTYRWASSRAHRRRANAATNTKWPPETAMRCMIPERRNRSSS